MTVDVLQGQVGVSKLGDMADEIIVNPGESLKFGAEGEIGDPVRSGAIPLNNSDVRVEVQNDKVKDAVIALAAEESKNADYQTGKSVIDVDGRRVRIEEYITRPAADQFKLVSLNERDTRFDYFTYTGTFNKNLPEDLSVALKDVGGKLNSQPDYFLKSYEMLMSNTVDKVTDTGSGGHLVKIELKNDGKYYLTDSDGNTRDPIDAAALQSNGRYEIYNPIKDSFSTVSASNKDEALKISVLDTSNDTYRDLSTGDVFWRTRYNSSEYKINDVIKTKWDKSNTAASVLAVDLDATFTNQPSTFASENPDGDDTLHNKLSLYYTDENNVTTQAIFDNYIIDDKGNIAKASQFDGLSTSAAYKNELNKWNYQTKIKADEMSGEINLVIDPRIATMSGLIQ